VKTLALLAAALIASTGIAFAQAPAKDAKKPAAKPAASAPAKPASAPAKKEPIDINRASKKDLMTLSGIGEARADAIIKNRPYRGKNELLDKKLVPANVYNDIKDRIVAKQW
jgi:DNA uptake protein ComE-like DNA-binding protein